MKIKLSNGKIFIIKVKHITTPMVVHTKDQYNRDVITYWDDKSTAVTIRQWTEKPYESTISVTGYAHCSYKDEFNKKYGKCLAYYNAITLMYKQNLISEEESVELDEFRLDRPYFEYHEAKCNCTNKPCKCNN